MNKVDFTTRVKRIKAELLALKQVHEYGLGRVDLPTYTFNQSFPPADAQKTLTLVLSFLKTTSQPMVQYDYTYMSDVAASFNIVGYNDGKMTLSYTLPNYSGFDLVLDIVFSSTAIITDIEWSVA